MYALLLLENGYRFVYQFVISLTYVRTRKKDVYLHNTSPTSRLKDEKEKKKQSKKTAIHYILQKKEESNFRSSRLVVKITVRVFLHAVFFEFQCS